VSRAQTNIAVLAEKPSVARDIAHVLGASTKGDGFLHGNGYVVTWAIGHLAALAQPHEINPTWKQWRRDTLPMLPNRWPLVVYEKTKHQFNVVKKILSSERISEIVCATDAFVFPRFQRFAGHAEANFDFVHVVRIRGIIGVPAHHNMVADPGTDRVIP